MSFLYHVTVGRGDPLAEQLTLRASRILGTGTEDDGVDEKTGNTEKVKQLFILALASAIYIDLPKRSFVIDRSISIQTYNWV